MSTGCHGERQSSNSEREDTQLYSLYRHNYTLERIRPDNTKTCTCTHQTKTHTHPHTITPPHHHHHTHTHTHTHKFFRGTRTRHQKLDRHALTEKTDTTAKMAIHTCTKIHVCHQRETEQLECTKGRRTEGEGESGTLHTELEFHIQGKGVHDASQLGKSQQEAQRANHVADQQGGNTGVVFPPSSVPKHSSHREQDLQAVIRVETNTHLSSERHSTPTSSYHLYLLLESSSSSGDIIFIWRPPPPHQQQSQAWEGQHFSPQALLSTPPPSHKIHHPGPGLRW